MGDNGPPGGWQLCKDDLIAVLDTVLESFRTDPDRVYLTGLSYGGYGAWYLAATYPDGGLPLRHMWRRERGTDSQAGRRTDAAVRFPRAVGMRASSHSGILSDVANALERTGHQSVRLTIHEDLGHDCWTRVYAGQDLYDWFLSHKRR